MSAVSKIVALIPARGGSKSIPRKNLVPLAGKPLIAWTIQAALESESFDRVIVSTDDEEIARTSEQLGAEVPFRRPEAFAGDESTSFSVAEHALQWLNEHGDAPGWLMFLQPTSPLRSVDDIRGAVALARDRQAPAVIGVSEASPHPCLARSIAADGTLNNFFPHLDGQARRQDFPPAYVVNGAIYVNHAATLLSGRTFQPPGTLAWVMPSERALDIDTPFDLRLVDLILSGKS